jgi:hypothetical protein
MRGDLDRGVQRGPDDAVLLDRVGGRVALARRGALGPPEPEGSDREEALTAVIVTLVGAIVGGLAGVAA